ncbi:hypothetical protein D6789_00490 [Candidatus Woesearchaeota archaeon]|nr:MAG: hypothetical protein D6789_00490 [Candidatus Woesearchaeota archaeon]
MLLVLAGALMLFNQFQIRSISSLLDGGSNGGSTSSRSGASGSVELAAVDVNLLQSTAQTVAAVFPELSDAQTADEVMGVLFPTGTPPYGEDLGVSFDEPVASLAKLAKMYRPLKAEVEEKDPEAFQRFVNLASKPRGVSCEFCCGVGPAGADSKGNSRCGCQHNPAVLSVALYLTAYTDYTDAEILREVMKWKTLFFPKNMIDIGSKIAGGDTSVLKNLPGMVGGC